MTAAPNEPPCNHGAYWGGINGDVAHCLVCPSTSADRLPCVNAPYYQDESVTLYHGDARELTAWLAADLLVTDPPYGRAWRQGDTNSARGWKSNRHDGIAGDKDTVIRDEVLVLWGDRPAIVFGDLMVPPPAGTKHVLVYDKGDHAGVVGAVGGYRRNVEGVYLLGRQGAGIGGRSAVLGPLRIHVGRLSKSTGHPHTKPVDLMSTLILGAEGAVVADPFAGSGSTLVAAKQLGRRAIGVEVDEAYCETIAKRLSQGVLDFGEAS